MPICCLFFSVRMLKFGRIERLPRRIALAGGYFFLWPALVHFLRMKKYVDKVIV
jgi:hypothetical protein